MRGLITQAPPNLKVVLVTLQIFVLIGYEFEIGLDLILHLMQPLALELPFFAHVY